MKVILFLLGLMSAWAPPSHVPGAILPRALARGKLVLKVVDGVPGALADSTLRPLATAPAPAASGSATQHLPTGTGSPGGHSHGLALRGGIDELLAEGLVVGVVGRLLDDDLLVVVGQLEDDELVLLAELQVIVGGYALLGDGRSAAGGWLAAAWLLRVGMVPNWGGRGFRRGLTDPD